MSVSTSTASVLESGERVELARGERGRDAEHVVVAGCRGGAPARAAARRSRGSHCSRNRRARARVHRYRRARRSSVRPAGDTTSHAPARWSRARDVRPAARSCAASRVIASSSRASPWRTCSPFWVSGSRRGEVRKPTCLIGLHGACVTLTDSRAAGNVLRRDRACSVLADERLMFAFRDDLYSNCDAIGSLLDSVYTYDEGS